MRYVRERPALVADRGGDYAASTRDRVPLVTADMPARPDGPYAVSKIFGEALGKYYAEAYGMEVVVVRLGTVGREDRPGSDARSFVSWLSHRDLAHLTERAIEAPGIKYEIVFGASDNTWKIYDTLRARRASITWRKSRASDRTTPSSAVQPSRDQHSAYNPARTPSPP